MFRIVLTVASVLLLAGVMIAYRLNLQTARPPEPSGEPPLANRDVGLDRPHSPLAHDSVRSSAGTSRAPNDPARGGLWHEADPKTLTALPPLRASVEGGRLLALEREEMMSLAAGDQVDLHIPQLGDRLTLWVRDVKTLSSGNTSVVGNIDGIDAFGVVITLGDNSTYATVGTPKGIFNVRGTADHAWVVPARSFNSHVDYSRPDFRVSSRQSEEND